MSAEDQGNQADSVQLEDASNALKNSGKVSTSSKVLDIAPSVGETRHS